MQATQRNNTRHEDITDTCIQIQLTKRIPRFPANHSTVASLLPLQMLTNSMHYTQANPAIA